MATNKEIFDRIQDLLHTALIDYLIMVSEGERLEFFFNLSYVEKNDKNLHAKIVEKQKLRGVYEDGKKFGVPFPDGLIVLKDSWRKIVEKKIYESRFNNSIIRKFHDGCKTLPARFWKNTMCEIGIKCVRLY